MVGAEAAIIAGGGMTALPYQDHQGGNTGGQRCVQ